MYISNNARCEQSDSQIQDFFDKAQQKVTAHVGSYQLELDVRPIDESGRVLAALSSVLGDALQIRGINLTVRDPEPLKSQARRLAIQDAKKRAAEIAEEVGVRLGSILSIQDGRRIGQVRSAGQADVGDGRRLRQCPDRGRECLRLQRGHLDLRHRRLTLQARRTAIPASVGAAPLSLLVASRYWSPRWSTNVPEPHCGP